MNKNKLFLILSISVISISSLVVLNSHRKTKSISKKQISKNIITNTQNKIITNNQIKSIKSPTNFQSPKIGNKNNNKVNVPYRKPASLISNKFNSRPRRKALFSQRLKNSSLLDSVNIDGFKVMLLNGEMGKYSSFIIKQKFSKKGQIIKEQAIIGNQFIVRLKNEKLLQGIQEELADQDALIYKTAPFSTTYKVKFSPAKVNEWVRMSEYLNSKDEWFSLVSADYIISN